MILAICLLLAQDYEKLAPYTGVRWADEAPEVEIDGAWHALLEIDGAAAADIVAFAKKTWPRIWKKRFEEDLVEVLSKMGKPPGATVALKVRDAKGERTLEGVAMTQDNRQRVWEAARKRDPEPEAPRFGRAHVAADLDELKKLIDERYAYATRRGVKYAEAIEALKARLPETIARPALAAEIDRILRLFEDGHTGAEGADRRAGYLPFLVAETEEGVVAFRPRDGFVKPDRPFVRSIDGVEIAKWLEAATNLTSIDARRARVMQYARLVRRELKLPEEAPLRIVFASATGETETVEGPLAVIPIPYEDRRPAESRVLEGNLGYLRLAEMDDEAVKEVGRRMEEFRGTSGIVIDVRGNGGGTRDALRELFPYFMKAGDAPRVANVAAPRLPVEGSLDDRGLYPAGWEKWSDAELQAIKSLKFAPEWTPPAGKFGEWHYFVLRPGGAPFHFDKPVAILMDGGCFSATDVFLGAFQGWRNVTLIGARSGGGSGRARKFRLTASGVVVRLSSMASFRPDGKLYDGRGVEPDIVVSIKPTDVTGKTDTTLETAIKRMRR